MKVIVDRARCMGNGICEAIHPEVFEVGDDGIVVIHEDKLRAAERDRIIEAVESCPASALRFVDDDV